MFSPAFKLSTVRFCHAGLSFCKIVLRVTTLASVVWLSACDSDDKQQQSDIDPSASSKTPVVSQKPAKLDKLAELYGQATQTLFSQRALSATLYGLSANDVGEYFSDQVENYSPENEDAMRKKLYSLSEQISLQTSETMNDSDIENKQVMASLTRYFAGHPDFPFGYIDTWMGMSPFIVNQINGPLITVPRYLQSEHAINNEKDALDYIERLGKLDQLVASVKQKFVSDVNKNWVPPKPILEGAIQYIKNFSKPEPSKHPLITSYIEKLNQVDSISKERKQKLILLAIDNVENIVYPAFYSMAETSTKMLEKARNESGIWAQPGGENYYQDAILQLGDSELSADEIHQVGLNEVARISGAMDKILSKEGRKKGTVGARMIALNKEKRFLYPDTDKGRKKLLADLNRYIEEVTRKMAGIFKTKPSYKVEVRAFPVEIQDNAPGGEYTSPSVDGSKPGIYWINLRDMKANPKYSLKSLTYHEANPGHHWQVALNLEQAQLPFLRRIAPYNAYIEGWALYSEKVAEEIGMYKNDPYGDLGRLQAELFRAVRLVVDTGLHYKRWNREQAIDYMVDKTGATRADMTSEVERYMVWPGQALGYKLGMLKILALRSKARTSLGKKFDLAEFHDVVLLGGAVPMKVLENKIDNWIRSKI